MFKLSNNIEDDLTEIMEGFQMFDTDNSGIIPIQELKESLEEFNLIDKDSFIYRYINYLCSNEKVKSRGGITSEEFILNLKAQITPHNKEGIKAIFDVFSQNDEKFPISKIYQTAKEVGDDKSSKEIKDLIEKAKIGEKEIDFDEFCEIMKEEEKNDEKMPTKINENNFENIKLQNDVEIENNKNLNENETNLDNSDQNEFKRYHRRYRNQKTSKGDGNFIKEDDNNDENNNDKENNNNKVYTRFRRKF